jgi:hypothetical protein
LNCALPLASVLAAVELTSVSPSPKPERLRTWLANSWISKLPFAVHASVHWTSTDPLGSRVAAVSTG